MKSEAIDPKTLETFLAKVIDSEPFAEGSRLQQFLRYVVDRYLEGNLEEINQYSIGVDAFGFSDQFDPQQSSVVRMEAGRLRRRLSIYYATVGKNDQVRIDIPKGSYVPVVTSRVTSLDVSEQIPDREKHISNETPSIEQPNLRVAIVPFQNISGDDQLDYFADGLAEEITSVLSLYKDFSIVPPIATRQFSGKQASLAQIAESFKARYVLDASIRRTKDQVRIIVRLSDTSDNTLLWANTYDTPFAVDNLLNIQDEIASNVVVAIANEYGGVIPRKVAEDAIGKGEISLSTYEASLHIHHYNLGFGSAQVHAQTLKSVQHALSRDPNNPMLLSSLAELKLDGYAQGWTTDTELPSEESEALIKKAISLDRNCTYAFFVLGVLRTNQRSKSKLLESIDLLLKFNHSVTSQAQAGWFLAIAGHYERGLKLLDDNLETIQYYPGWFRHAYFLFHYQNGRYENALAEATQFNMPELLWDPVERAAALGKLGRYEEGKQAIESLLDLYPSFFKNPKRYLEMFIIDDDLLDDVIQGLELSRK